MYRPNLRRLGLVLLLIAASIYALSTRWIQSRHYRLLYAPVSLAGETLYDLHVQDEGDYNLFVSLWPRKNVLIDVKWSISGGPGIIQAGEKKFVPPTDGSYLGTAHLRRGTYRLRFSGSSNGSAGEPLQPLLQVVAGGHVYQRADDLYDRSVIVAGLLGILGVGLILFSSQRKSFEPVPRGVALEPPDRVKRFPGYGRRLQLGNFGFYGAVFFGLLMMVLFVVTGWRLTSWGIKVQLLKIGEAPSSSIPWERPLILRLETEAPKHGELTAKARVFINEDEVPPDQLKLKLREILVTRKDRTVFVQGSESSEVGPVFQLIDIAKGAYASRVVLDTSQRRSAQIRNVR